MAIKATIFVLFLFTFIKSNAQYDITVGVGTKVNASDKFPCPLQDTFTGSRAQYLFRASELNALGMDSGSINSVAFFVRKLNNHFGTVEGLSVKMGTTTATTLGVGTWVANLKTVYTPKDWTVTVGRNIITFDSTFDWDGIQNLVLEVCNGSATAGKTANPSILQTVTTYNASRSYAANALGNLCGATSATNNDSSQRVRPVTQFNWNPIKYCDAKPVVGTVTASSLTLCPSIPLTLTSTGGTYASLITYQWQRLNPITGIWESTDPLDNQLTLTLFQDTTNSYRLKAYCAVVDDSAFSNIVTVTTPKVPGGNQYIINKNHTGNVWPLSDTFKSFTATVAAMSCGIKSAVTYTVLPGSGPYNEQMIVNGRIINSSDVNTITYKGNGETINFNPTTTSRAVIKLKGAKYFTLDSINVNAGNGNIGIGIQLQNNADSNTIKHCTINAPTSGTGFSTVAASAGIVVGGTDASAIGLDVTSLCDNISINSNKINGGASGIVIAAGANGENTYIDVKDNNAKNFYQYGIYVNGTYNTTVEHNIISRPAATLSPATVSGIYIANLNRTLRVVRNRIHSPFASQTTTTGAFNGIHLDAANAGTSPAAVNEFHIANNLIYNIQGDGLQNGILNNNTSFVQLYHNTVALDDDLGNPTLATSTTRCYMQNALPTSITLVNNLFTIKRGGTAPKHCIYLGTPAVANFKDLSFNNYINDASGGTNNYIGFWASNRLSLGDWITGSNETTALNIQPVYAEPITPNMDTAKYNPSNAFLDAKGKAVYEKIDLLGATTTRLDIGCYEFIPAPCIAANLNGLTEIYINNRKVVSDSTICEGITINLKLKITGATGAQTNYQWERAINDSNNVASLFGPSLISADTAFLSSGAVGDSAYYFRCKLSCTGSDYYTNWRKISVRPAMVTGNYAINSTLTLSNYTAGLAGGEFNNYDTAVKAMRYCGITGTSGNVQFNVVPLSGPYNEQILIDSIKGVTATRQVVFKGNNTTIALPTTTPTTNERAVFKLQKAHWFNFDSIVVDASQATTFGYGFQLLNNADSNTITNCTIKASTTQTVVGFAGIVVNSAGNALPTANGNSFCDANKFDNNTIIGGFHGITLVGGAATATPNSFNIITNNKISDFYNTGLYLSGTSNTLVEKNIFSRPTRTPLAVGYGINLTGSPTVSSKISKNRFTNFFGSDNNSSVGAYGINFNNVDASNAKEVVVVNNAFYNMGGTGILYPLYNNASDFILYYHNSISMEDTIPATALSAGFYQVGAASGIVFKNNVVHVKRAGNINKYCINMQTVGATGTILESNYNDFSINTYLANNFVGNYGNSTTTSPKKLLSDWRTASSQDANSVNYDPLYVDSKNGDLHPQFYLLDNIGLAGLANDDILNTPRPTTGVDMGAYEFTAPPCPSPLLAGASVVTPSSGICLEIPIKLTLSGNSPVGQINFQWQDSAAGVPGWSNLGPLNYSPDYDTVSSVRNFYRCIVTCAATGNSVISTPVELILNPLLPAGTYTIDCNFPTSPAPNLPGDNFHSLNDAITAMQCGIRGSVVFDVKGCTFNEQVKIPYIAGTGSNSTITFQGFNNNAAGATLTFAPTTAAANYTLRYDSATYVTFKDLNIENTDPTNGRVVEFINKASNSKLVNCIITTPKTVSSGTNNSAVYTNQFRGKNITIKDNTIRNGSNGIYFAGTTQTATNLTTPGHIIDNNTITTPYAAGIFIQYTDKLVVTKNNITYRGEAASNTSGIYANYCDSGMLMKNNKITIDSVNTAVFGIQLINSRNKPRTGFAQINGNEIYANSGNIGRVVGLSIATSDSVMVKNNVIAINSGASGSFGLENKNNVTNTFVAYYNNTVQITLTDTTSVAAQMQQTPAGRFILTNNIFSNIGGGKAMFMSPVSNFTCDYNMLYATGKNLVNTGTAAANYYQTITQWRKASSLDKWSMVYQPAFISKTDLHPDLNSSDVWAIHGRGNQIVGNTSDINDNIRPDKLVNGAPDLGAYEFLPLSIPTAAKAKPETPDEAAILKKEQVFYFGSDTIMRIKWDSLVHPMDTVKVRRYSGVIGPGITAQNKDSMYFYTKVEVPGNGAYKHTMKLYYISPWYGSIPKDSIGKIGMGARDPVGIWDLKDNSTSNVSQRVILNPSTTVAVQLDKFTGLVNPDYPSPSFTPVKSNEGREFWVAYPRTATGTLESYVLYLTSRDSVRVHVDVDCENIHEVYDLVPNVVTVTTITYQSAKRTNAGVFCSGIHIQVDSLTPKKSKIVAYAHCYGGATSGAGLLLPTDTWGYEYRMLGLTQQYGGGNYSYYYAIATHDSTKIQYTNTVPVQAPGTATGTVMLNKGEWYQVLASSETSELSGSTIKSIDNGTGKCYPIAVFSGSSRTQNSIPCGSGGDFMMQQNFPATAWGMEYLTAPTSGNNGAKDYQGNLFRIGLKDANTEVKINGNVVYSSGITFPQPPARGIFNLTYNAIGQYIEYVANNGNATATLATEANANYISSDKPITVAQYLGGACTGDGDPEMMYLSPIKQGVKSIAFYRNDQQDINKNVLTLIGSSEDVPSLTEGPTFTPLSWTYSYPLNNYTEADSKNVYIYFWPTAAPIQVNVSGDSAFTAITYGLGPVESYGYNAGTLVNSLVITDQGVCPAGQPCPFKGVTSTCNNTPTAIVTGFPLIPDSITWMISGIPGVSPNTDVTIKKDPLTGEYTPAPIVGSNQYGQPVYTFTTPSTYTFSTVDTFKIPVRWYSSQFEGCDKSQVDTQTIIVKPAPKVGFINQPKDICLNTAISFVADTTESGSGLVRNWFWHSSTNGALTDSTNHIGVYTYSAPGTDTIKLHVRGGNYCLNDSSQVVVINPSPTIQVVSDSIYVCKGSSVSISVQSPDPNITYSIFDNSVGGSSITATNNGNIPFVINNINSDTIFYVEAMSAKGCVSVARKPVKVFTFKIPTPEADSSGACIGATGVLTVKNPNTGLTYAWYAVTTAGSRIDTGTTLTISPVVNTTTYYLQAYLNGCPGDVRTPVILSAATPPNLAVVKDTVTVCKNDSAIFSIASPDATATYNWYTASTGGTATAGVNYSIVPATANASYWVSATSVNNCTTPRLKVELIVLDLPVVEVVKDSIAVCNNSNVTFTIKTPIIDATYSIYSNALGGTPIASTLGNSPTFTFNNVTANASYFIECKLVTGCTSLNRKEVKVTALPIPVPAVTQNNLTVCTGYDTAFYVQNPDINGTYYWYDAATAGNKLDSGIVYNIKPVTASGTYYLEANVNGCVSATRLPVVLNAAVAPTVAVVTNPVTVCNGDAAIFNILNPDANVKYNWYSTTTGGTAITPLATSFTALNMQKDTSFYVDATSINGCISVPRLKLNVKVNQRPVVTVVFPDSVTLCKGLRQTFCVLNPLVGAKYKWYNQSSGCVLVQADSSCFTTPPLVDGDTTYYVDGEKDGCISFTRATVKIKALQELDTTSVTGTKVETNFIRFDWTALQNATGYKITVTVNGGTPSTTTYGSGTLNHTIFNLLPGDTAWATVVALGINPCQNSTSRAAFGKTVLNTTYYPNVFTPNGDGKNDKIVICGSSFKDIKYAVYNQWGEKIWEVNGLVATDTKGCYLLWDGTQRGVLQPVGVYMFTSKITFLDGKVEEKKGTINLIR